jgi:hypothetical protein
MKLLILCPGKLPESIEEIRCFTDVLNYYLPTTLARNIDSDILRIPADNTDDHVEELSELFRTIEVDQYAAILTLGLRFYSKIPREVTELLRSRFNGLFCQVHDGSRMDQDPVDYTFTFKNDDERMSVNPGWYSRHIRNNVYMGWAADPDLNIPRQSKTDLRILVDHTNYGGNEVDLTKDILYKIKDFIDSEIWKEKYESISVRRFDSGRVVDVDFDDIENITVYDRTAIPINEISKEHSEAHIFMVTHPESVGLVVLETSMAGALTVTPNHFIPKDRLQTVRHIEWEHEIPWEKVLESIDIEKSREVALLNSWDNVSKNIINKLVSVIVP